MALTNFDVRPFHESLRSGLLRSSCIHSQFPVLVLSAGVKSCGKSSKNLETRVSQDQRWRRFLSFVVMFQHGPSSKLWAFLVLLLPILGHQIAHGGSSSISATSHNVLTDRHLVRVLRTHHNLHGGALLSWSQSIWLCRKANIIHSQGRILSEVHAKICNGRNQVGKSTREDGCEFKSIRARTFALLI